MRAVVLCDDDEAGGVLVEPVHDSGPLNATATRQALAMPEYRIDESAGRRAGRRVSGHASGLVHHEEVGVLVHDLQWDLLSADIGGLWQRNRDRDGVAGS